MVSVICGGEDVVQVIVRGGWAFDWPRYSGGSYADDQAYARANKLGKWREDYAFVFLWDHRRGQWQDFDAGVAISEVAK